MFTLKARHAPDNGLHFWAALCLASILGCNTGDYFASFFGLLGGLPALVMVFALVLGCEQRDPGNSKAFYWIAIILVRTAATNLADFVSHQTGVVYALVTLAALLLAVMLLTRVRRGATGRASDALPTIDGAYWKTMLIAGTLGTALGDFCSVKTGLGFGGASIVLSVLVAILIGVKVSRPLAFTLSYWLVVAIRTAGTSVGDWFARHIGLWQSTLAFTILLTTFLWARPRRALAVPAA